MILIRIFWFCYEYLTGGVVLFLFLLSSGRNLIQSKETLDKWRVGLSSMLFKRTSGDHSLIFLRRPNWASLRISIDFMFFYDLVFRRATTQGSPLLNVSETPKLGVSTFGRFCVNTEIIRLI